MEISWERFENALFETLLVDFPPPVYRVVFNLKVRGKHSKSIRQIDVAVFHMLENPKLLIVADAKRHKRPIDVRQVEGFIGMLGDLDAELGIIAPCTIHKTQNAYTKSAFERAKPENVRILPIYIEDALILNWMEVARSIYPDDWHFHQILAKGLYHLSQGENELAIDSLDSIPYDEWQELVNYGLRNSRLETEKFLRTILEHHYDSGWRFQAAANLYYNGLLSKQEIQHILHHESEPEFQELFQ